MMRAMKPAVLFDIDDTITEAGLLPEASYSAMWAMRRAGIAAVVGLVVMTIWGWLS